jgi:group I intron endonuclease
MENEIYGYIYKITNIITNKAYIGQTTNKKPINRFYRHISNSKNYKKKYPLQLSINKYGKENFIFQIIDIAYNRKQLNLLEGVYISWFKTLTPNGYNLTMITNGQQLLSRESINKIRLKSSEPHRIKSISSIGKKTRGVSYKNTSSKYVGVYFSKNRWIAKHHINNKSIYLGSYLTEEDAAKARDIAEYNYIGINAILNFPELLDNYKNNSIKINKCVQKKSDSTVKYISYCNTRKKYRYYKNKTQKYFSTKEEAEQFALSF